MPDLMARAAEFIAGKLAAELSRPVTVLARKRLGRASTASVGRSRRSTSTTVTACMRFETRDYIVRTDALGPGAASPVPASARRPDHRGEHGMAHVAYEVVSGGGKPGVASVRLARAS
jgi:hypothetical protein